MRLMNEAGSWLQRQGDACRNEQFVIFKEEDESGQEIVMWGQMKSEFYKVTEEILDSLNLDAKCCML